MGRLALTAKEIDIIFVTSQTNRKVGDTFMGRGRGSRRRQKYTGDWRSDDSTGSQASYSGSLDGQPVQITEGATGRQDRLDIYYGGEGQPDGRNHGHIVSNDGVNVDYMREPGQDRNNPTVDNPG